MKIDIYEYILINNLENLFYREYGKDPFYSIVEIGESYENFKNTFQDSTFMPIDSDEDAFDDSIEEPYDFQPLINIGKIKKLLKDR